MSRKCPKRNHVFLNWLRTNRSRFPFQPRVVGCGKNGIDFELRGVTPVLKFFFSSRSISGISIAVMWQGKCWDLIGDFDVAEERTDKGWMCRLDLPDKRQYWPTREELWIEHCFERFLAWCNNELAPASWLALYAYSGATWASLLLDEAKAEPGGILVPLGSL
jgi:hypothetical protein